MARMNPMTADGIELVRLRLAESIASQQSLLVSDCVHQAVAIAELIGAALASGRKVVFFGNGGSAADAGHLAGEFLGRYAHNSQALAAVSLPDSMAALTAIGNDYGYREVFARQLRGLCVPGDVAVGLTTSGNSENMIRAFAAANDLGVVTVALTGKDGGRVAGLVNVCVRIPTDNVPLVQEACMHLGHTICELVERRLRASG